MLISLLLLSAFCTGVHVSGGIIIFNILPYAALGIDCRNKY